MGRILAVDFGHVRIGLSLSDPLNMFATPLENIKGSTNPERAAQNLIEAVGALCKEKKIEIELIVIGLPIHLDGKESERSTEVRAFAKYLESHMTTNVHLFDERMTTVQAERAMLEANLSRKKRARTIDGISSTILLQSFLDLQARKVP